MPPEATPVEQWPINTYWRGRAEQHWYICFCLLMSAIQDYFSGRQLVSLGNLNWAATCYYYSLMHTGRLIVFCSVGDFPRRHQDLQKLFLNIASLQNGHIRSTGNNDSYQLNWLSGFMGESRSANCSAQANVRICLSDLLDVLNQLAVDNFATIKVFGCNLSKLGDLRNDSNYEALLIAHERHHEVVEPAFQDLACKAKLAAKHAVTLALAVYCACVENSSVLHERVDEFKGMSDLYVQGRLMEALKDKFGETPSFRAEMGRISKKIIFGVEVSTDVRRRITDRISMDIFSEKASLMETFKGKIQELAM